MATVSVRKQPKCLGLGTRENVADGRSEAGMFPEIAKKRPEPEAGLRAVLIG